MIGGVTVVRCSRDDAMFFTSDAEKEGINEGLGSLLSFSPYLTFSLERATYGVRLFEKIASLQLSHSVVLSLTAANLRCDPVICAGDWKEKLASILLEPFVAHFKYAKDQVSKGGVNGLDEYSNKSAASGYKGWSSTCPRNKKGSASKRAMLGL
ncbi:hypothetical protein Tco_0245741 [Tanacetum coccineum]